MNYYIAITCMSGFRATFRTGHYLISCLHYSVGEDIAGIMIRLPRVDNIVLCRIL